MQAENTGSSNTGVGYNALFTQAGASNNTAVGQAAGDSITTGANNTFAGAGAGDHTDNGAGNVAVGQGSLSANCGDNNTAIGLTSLAVATGGGNTAIGHGSGNLITSGQNNSILGGFNGNQGGLDIRTANNHVILSDGDGNIRFKVIANGVTFLPGVYNNTTAEAANVVAYSGGGGDMYRSTSALKYKQDIRDVEDFDINALRPVRYKSKCEVDDQTKDHLGIVADEAAEAGFEELVRRDAEGEVEGFQYERLTVVLLKSIQSLKAELSATNDALAARITDLEG